MFDVRAGADDVEYPRSVWRLPLQMHAVPARDVPAMTRQTGPAVGDGGERSDHVLAPRATG